MGFYKSFLRPILFAFDPETTHDLALRAIKTIHHCPFLRSIAKKTIIKSYSQLYNDKSHISLDKLKVNLLNMSFENPIGLAAGFDKNCEVVLPLLFLGFGFIEIGTITACPQKGNPKPRIFRLPRDQAIINQMGFNNDGAEAIGKRLAQLSSSAPIGINIGKSRIIPIENTHIENIIEDYLKSFKIVYPYGQYIVINISSPNTPELRKLQYTSYLEPLLSAVLKERQNLVNAGSLKKAVFLKISPDCSWNEIDDILAVASAVNIDGIVAANTSQSREGLRTSSKLIPKEGGLSGLPLRERSTEIIRYIFQATKGDLPIIGVGGVFSAQDAIEKFQAGASLVQVYTALIYEGPAIVQQILQGILSFMELQGIKSIAEIIGTSSKV